MTTTATVAGPTGARTLLHRWPTLLALALIAVNVTDLGDGLELAVLLPVGAVGYLAIAVLDRPRLTWTVLVLLLAAVTAVRAAGLDEWPLLIAAGTALVIAGLVGGQLRRPGLYALQPVAAAVFVLLGLLALAVSPGAGRWVLAAALAGHAGWDAAHWRADRIVARSFAEWCAVLDLGLAIAVLVLV